jgi:chemotaxis protein MotB
MAIQVAFQEMGVFQASSKKVPMRDDNAMPFEAVQVIENVVKQNDLKKLVNPMKGELTNSAEVESLMDAKSELEKALAPEMQRNEVTMELHREGLVVSLKEMGFFESGSDVIRPKSMDAIIRLANVLRRRNENIRFEGHTDNVPIHNAHFASNWQLSTSRATEMIKLMITQYGIPADHLAAAGYAEFHPVATNATPEGRAQNRRMDVVILSSNESDSEPASTQPPEVAPGRR